MRAIWIFVGVYRTAECNTGPETTKIIVREKARKSGCLEKHIPIGEFRDGACRVRERLPEKWSGLSVKNGCYIKRSVNPPLFSDAERFYI